MSRADDLATRVRFLYEFLLMFPPFTLTATRALFREIAFRHLRIDFNIVVLRAFRELAATRKLNKWVVDDGCALQ